VCAHPTQTKKVDYDQIAAQYNRRYRANPLVNVELALAQLGRALKAERILEVGCGTGRWLQGLTKFLPEAQFFGLDASLGMLTKASVNETPPNLVQAKAAKPPFVSTKFDFIFCVNALHHFDDPTAFINQTSQLLRPGGLLAIIGQVPHDRRNRWYVYDFFEGTYENDLHRFPTWGTVVDWMIGAGFGQIHWEPVEWISDDKIGWAVLDDPFLQKKAISQLALLSDKAYAAGLGKIRDALKQAEADGETLTFRSQLRLDMLTGVIPKEG
jgi:SAM-dependent methyltransferase